MVDNNNSGGKGPDELGIGLKILSFCIPLAGAILFFVYKEEYPNKSKTACYAALIGVGVGIVLQVILVLTGVGMGAM